MASIYTPVEDYVLISISEAKQQLRLDESFTEEDTLLEQYILAAQGAAEQYIERTIVSEVQTITQGVFSDIVKFTDWRPIYPADVSISVIPEGETEPEVVDPDAYYFTRTCNDYQVLFKEAIPVADVSNAVVVTVNCNIPMIIKQACLLKVSEFYMIRENRSVTNRETFEKLLFPFRKY